jgi:hypothetical protein
MSCAQPSDMKCECGGRLEPCNYYPVDAMARVVEDAQRYGWTVAALFGCRGCGEWFAFPAERVNGPVQRENRSVS